MSETKFYIGDDGTGLIVNLGTDIDGATDTKLKVRKPDRQEVEWPASVVEIDGAKNFLKYITQTGDLDQVGTYKLQASLTLGPWSGLGETTSFQVHSTFC